jgi:hypothetical protein
VGGVAGSAIDRGEEEQTVELLPDGVRGQGVVARGKGSFSAGRIIEAAIVLIIS